VQYLHNFSIKTPLHEHFFGHNRHPNNTDGLAEHYAPAVYPGQGQAKHIKPNIRTLYRLTKTCEKSSRMTQDQGFVPGNWQSKLALRCLKSHPLPIPA